MLLSRLLFFEGFKENGSLFNLRNPASANFIQQLNGLEVEMKHSIMHVPFSRKMKFSPESLKFHCCQGSFILFP